jgi:hypothetical protein
VGKLAAPGGRPRDHYPAGECGQDDGHATQPGVPGGEAASGLYLRLVVNTGRGQMTAYFNGRVLQRWPYKLLND